MMSTKKLIIYYFQTALILHISLRVSASCPVISKSDFKVIQDVREHIQASKVLFICNFNYDNLNRETMMQKLMRQYSSSDAGVPLYMQFLDFKTLNKCIKYYNRYSRSIMLVVILDSLDDLRIYEAATDTCDMSLNKWFVYFLGSGDEGMHEFCQHPTGNRFNLKINSNVMVKCYGDPVLKEWYSVRTDQTSVINLAKWDSIGALVVTNFHPLQERRSLAGKKLRIGIINEHLSNTYQEDARPSYYEVIVNELAKSMNFTKETIRENTYGFYDQTTKTFSGMVGRIINKEIDIGLGEFTLNNDRVRAIDFAPITVTEQYLFIRLPNSSDFQWSSYVQAFNRNTWIVFVITLLMLPVPLLIIIKTTTRKMGQFFLVVDHYLQVWRIFCLGPLPAFSRTAPLQITYFTITLTCWLMHVHYMAFLTSYIAFHKPDLPFTDMKSFAEDGSYSLILIADSEDFDDIRNSPNEEEVNARKYLKQKKDLPISTLDAINQICNEKVVFTGLREMMELLTEKASCRITNIGSAEVKTNGLILAKNSPYTEFVNYYLHKYRSYGILLALSRKSSKANRVKSTKYLSVNIYAITPIFIILAIGVGLAMLGLMFEQIFYERASEKKMKKILRSIRIKTRLQNDGIMKLHGVYLE